MTLQKLLSTLLTLCLAAAISGCAKDKDLEAQARISRTDAEKIALAKVPGGKIAEGGLEKEKGKLIYSFDIATPGMMDITEVQVDAKTGVVVSVDVESPEKEAAEKVKETKEKKGRKSENKDDVGDEKK